MELWFVYNYCFINIANWCTSLPFLPGVLADAKQLELGQPVTLTCLRGYRFDDGSATKVAACRDGNWNITSTGCKVTSCPQILTAASSMNDSRTVYGTSVAVTCHWGYQFSGFRETIVTKCEENQQWAVVPPPCSQITCPTPPSMVGASASLPSNTSLGGQVFYQCHVGLRFLDGYSSKTLRCGSHETWIPEAVLDCTETRCPPVPEVGNSTTNTTVAEQGTVVRYSCTTGHRFPDGTDAKHATCGNANVWLDVPPPCEMLHCPRLANLPKRTVSSNLTVLNSTLRLDCVVGYLFPGNETSLTVQCLSNGSWSLSESQLTCLPVTCLDPPDIQGGSVQVHGGKEYGNTATYTCTYGHWFQPDVYTANVTCTQYGVWEVLPFCKEVTCPPLPTWDNVEPSHFDRRFGVSIRYNCSTNSNFADYAQTKLALCGPTGKWLPDIELCIENIEEIVYTPAEAQNARNIGLFAIGLVAIFVLGVICIDSVKLVSDLRMLISNVRQLICGQSLQKQSTSVKKHSSKDIFSIHNAQPDSDINSSGHYDIVCKIYPER